MAPAALLDNLVHRVNVGDTLTRTADRLPTKTALVDGDRRFTYRELDDLTDRLARALVDLGYAPGDSLALASGNSAEFLASTTPARRPGGVRPAQPGLAARRGRLRARPRRRPGVVVETQLAPWVEQALAGLDGVRDVVVAPAPAVRCPAPSPGGRRPPSRRWWPGRPPARSRCSCPTGRR